LTTGKKLRNMIFYPTSAKSNKEGIIILKNGMVFDGKKGELTIGGKRSKVRNFIATQNTKSYHIKLQSQLYHMDGEYSVIYMKSYGRIIVLDVETFNSMYVQMFILGKYDKNLFELVISSPYSKIYKLKK
jgi:dolichyl-diphosphooligosaccharide--protein glycosyltransferase/undecaprenyl-diphosphooligosaccharide--protein glycosyltransferase